MLAGLVGLLVLWPAAALTQQGPARAGAPAGDSVPPEGAAEAADGADGEAGREATGEEEPTPEPERRGESARTGTGADAKPRRATGQGPEISAALMEIVARGKLDPKDAEGLTVLLSGELGQREGLRTITPSEISSMLGLEAQRQLLGCTDSSCLAELGGALGVEYLVTGDAARVGGQYVLTLSLVDVVRAHTLRRVSVKGASPSGLAREVPKAVDRLLEPLGLGGRTGAVSETRLAGFERPFGGYVFWGGLALGTLLVAGGGYLTLDAREQARRHNSGETVLSQADAERLRGQDSLGWIFLGAGIGSILTGVLFDQPQPVMEGGAQAARGLPSPRAQVALVPLSRGGALFVRVNY